MFSVGDKVVYPMHGAGIVQAIEQHELAGEAVDYLVMVMLLTDMRVMVPLKNVERVGLRHIISKDEIPGIEKVLGTPVEFNAKGITWNRRFNMYLDKMKSGISCRRRKTRKSCPPENEGFWETRARYW